MSLSLGAEVIATSFLVFYYLCLLAVNQKFGKRVILALLIDKVWVNHGISEFPVSCCWLYCVEGMSWL